MDSTSRTNTGGGGADAAHGLQFHMAITILLLFTLKDISQEDLGFQYEICLEKKGYDKFDDIVVRYLSGDKWIEICVQSKHAAALHAKITADEFVGKSNKKGFSLIDYFKSFKLISKNSCDTERYFVILCNRQYSSDKDKHYPWFKRKDINVNNILLPNLFPGTCFQIECNEEVINHFTLDGTEPCDVKEFCSRFLYICDKRDLNDILKCKYNENCQGDEDKSKTVKARLVCLFHDMYQHKSNPSQSEINEIFMSKQFYFKVERPDANFTGRSEEIFKIHESLSIKKTNDIFNVVVTGMAGIGKTQLVKKYISENTKTFKNIIWINGENETTLSQNFTELAKNCEVISASCIGDFKSVIAKVYQKFKTKTLFIFDNADKVLLNKHENEWIYLPNSLESNVSIILISQGKQWSTKTKIELKNFSEQTADKYLQVSLSQLESSKSERQDLARIFHFWPLALSIAVSYISQLHEDSLGEIFTISQFIRQFQSHESGVFEHVPQKHEMHTYNKSLSTLWEIIKQKLKNDEVADNLCVRILEILSFTEADNFPINIFIHQMSSNVKNALLKLNNFSLISQSGKYLSLHRSLQAVIRNSLSDKEKHLVLENGQEIFVGFMEEIKPLEFKLTEGNVQITKFWEYILESKRLTVRKLNIVVPIINKLCNSRDYHLGIIFAEKVIHRIIDICGTNHEIVYIVKLLYAEMLVSVEMLERGEEEIQSVLSFYQETNESVNKSSIITRSKVSLSNIYIRRGRLQEALSSINDAIESQIKMGYLHEEIEILEQQKINILFQLARSDEANILLKKHLIIQSKLDFNKVAKVNLLKNKTDIHTMVPIKSETISVLNNRYNFHASLNLNMLDTLNSMSLIQQQIGNNHEAITLINYVINENESHHGLEHPDTLKAMIQKSMFLQDDEKYEKALDIINKVLQIQQSTLEESHFSTLSTLTKKATLLDKLDQNNEALRVFKKVFTLQKLCILTNQKILMKTINCIVNLLEKMKKFNEAFIFCEEVTLFFSENLHNEMQYINEIKMIKAKILNKTGRTIEALDVIREVTLPLQKTGTLDCNETQECVLCEGEILMELQKNEEALKCFEMVLKVTTENLYFNLSIINKCLQSKMLALVNLEKYEEALKCNDVQNKLILEHFGETNQITQMHFSNLYTKYFILYKMKKYKDALDINHLIYQKIIHNNNCHISGLLLIMNSKFSVLVEMKETELALLEIDQIIGINKEHFGNNHESSLLAMNNKGILLLEAERYEDALCVFNDAIQASQKMNKIENVNLALGLINNKCAVLETLCEYKQCVKILKKAIDIQQNKLPSDIQLFFMITYKKTRIQNLMGDYKETIAMLSMVNSVCVQNVGDVLVLETLQNIAIAYLNVLQYDKALQLNKQILNRNIENFDICNESTKINLNETTKVLIAMKRRKDALTVLDFQLVCLKEKLGEDDSQVVQKLIELILMLVNELEDNNVKMDLLKHVNQVSEKAYGKNHKLTIFTIQGMSIVLQSLGKIDEARKLLENLYKFQCKNNGNENELTLDTLTDISTMLHGAGKPEESLKLFEEILRTQIRILPNHHDKITNTMQKIIDIFIELKKFEDAINVIEKIITIFEKKGGNFNIQKLNTILKKATVFQVMGKFDDALDIVERVIKEHISYNSCFDVRIIKLLQEKCKILKQINKNELALTCFKEIVEICMHNFGKTHLKTVTALIETSKQLFIMEKYEEAEDLLKTCLQQQTLTLGENNSDTMETKHILIQTLIFLQKHEEAISLVDKILTYELQRNEMNEKFVIELKCIKSSSLIEIKRYEEALELTDTVLQYYTSHLGLLNETVLNAMNSKCVILHNLSRYTEALSLYDDLMRLQVQAFGINHKHTMVLKKNRINTLLELNKNEEAIEEWKQILECQTDKFGEDSDECMNTTYSIARLNATIPNSAEALKLFDKVYSYKLKTLGKLHIETQISLNDKASMLLMLGQLKEALEIFDELLTYNDSKKLLSVIKAAKGFILFKLQKYEDAVEFLTESYKQKKELFGQKHSSTMETANLMVLVYLQLERFVDAMTLLELVLNWQETVKGTNSFEFLTHLKQKAMILAKLSDCNEALYLGKNVYRKMTQVLGFEHAETKSALQFIQDLNNFVKFGTTFKTKFSFKLMYNYDNILN